MVPSIPTLEEPRYSQSLERGLARVEVNQARIAEDLEAEQAWEVVAEAIQTLMRRHGLPKPYETLKELTRGRRIDRRLIEEFIATLPLDDSAKRALRELNPRSYVGLAAKLVAQFAPKDLTPNPFPRGKRNR